MDSKLGKLDESGVTSGSDRGFSYRLILVVIGAVVGGVLAVPLTRLLPERLWATFEINGQIGDFVGGILNPIIALLALLWLQRGVRMQEIELKATRDSLGEANKESRMQTRINALSVALQIDMVELERLEKRRVEAKARLSEIIRRGGLTNQYSDHKEMQRVKDLNQRKDSLEAQVSRLNTQIEDVYKRIESRRAEIEEALENFS